MDVTLYPDEDWTVDVVHCTDVSAVTLTAPDESQSVRIETTYKVLAEIGRRWADRMGDDEVTANGRNPDRIEYNALSAARRTVAGSAPWATRTLDAIDQKIENLETLLSDYRAEKGEEARYPGDFQPGDWFTVPPTKTWRKIDRVGETGSGVGPLNVHYIFGGKDYFQPVRRETRYPYMTAAAMAAVPEQEAR